LIGNEGVSRRWEKARRGKAIDAQSKAGFGFGGEMSGALPKSVFGRPLRRVGSPLDRKMFEDESGARQVAGRTDDLGAGPAVVRHDALAVEDVLDGVLGLAFFDDGVGRNSLGKGERGHDVCFDELVVSWTAGEDEVRCDAGFEFADALESAFALLR
jgi:hypothetical protein